MRILFVVFALWACQIAYGQQSLSIPELSPPGILQQTVGFTTISVYYERPAARGRSESEIFGKLVPFGKVWRTGAGKYTTIKFDSDVWIDGKKVPAGKYALFTIPDRDKWTIIINSDTSEYAAFSYDQRKDLVRTVVETKRSQRYYESLTIDIDFIPNDAKIYISWLNTQVGFSVNTGSDEKVMSFIRENLIQRDSDKPEWYESAIIYYRWHRLDRMQLMKFIDKGIAVKNDRWWYYWKVEELIKDGKLDEAAAAARAGIDAIRKSNESDARKAELILDFDDYLKNIKEMQSRKK